MNAHDYLIDHSSFDWNDLLTEWHWLLPKKFSIWLLTRAGDLFITLPDGSIHMLEVGGGELNKLADSRDEFCDLLDQDENANDWLMIQVIDSLTRSGHMLDEGRCFSYTKLPILGGGYDMENRVSLPIREHFGVWGSVHRQLIGVPDGTQVTLQVTK